MEDSDEEDPIEELCEYLDGNVGQSCEDEHILVKDTTRFYNICYEYKKKLRNGDIHHSDLSGLSDTSLSSLMYTE